MFGTPAELMHNLGGLKFRNVGQETGTAFGVIAGQALYKQRRFNERIGRVFLFLLSHHDGLDARAYGIHAIHDKRK